MKSHQQLISYRERFRNRYGNEYEKWRNKHRTERKIICSKINSNRLKLLYKMVTTIYRRVYRDWNRRNSKIKNVRGMKIYISKMCNTCLPDEFVDILDEHMMKVIESLYD